MDDKSELTCSTGHSHAANWHIINNQYFKAVYCQCRVLDLTTSHKYFTVPPVILVNAFCLCFFVFIHAGCQNQLVEKPEISHSEEEIGFLKLLLVCCLKLSILLLHSDPLQETLEREIQKLKAFTRLESQGMFLMYWRCKQIRIVI